MKTHIHINICGNTHTYKHKCKYTCIYLYTQIHLSIERGMHILEPHLQQLALLVLDLTFALQLRHVTVQNSPKVSCRLVLESNIFFRHQI